MKQCLLKVLRDSHGFSSKDLTMARKYIKGKEYYDNNKAITDSVIEDSGLFLEVMYRKDDKELAVINDNDPRIGNAPLYIHGITKDVAIATYPDSNKPDIFPLDALKVDDTNLHTYIREGLHEDIVDKTAEATLSEVDKAALDAEAEYKKESLEKENIIFGRGKYGSDPKSQYKKEGDVVLKGEKINKLAALNKLAKELDSMDNIGTSDEHKAHLSKVMKVLFSGSGKPMQEMNVYLNKAARSNGGFIDLGKDPGIYLARGQRDQTLGTDMSLIEKFVHELVHGASNFGLNNRSPEIAKQIILLKELRHATMKVLTPEDIMGDVSMSSETREAELRIAKARIKYMNENLEEFLAYALTHEGVIEKLKTVTIKKKTKKYESSVKGVFEQLLDILRNIFDIALKTWTGKQNRRTMQGDLLAMQLVSDFARVNQEVKLEQNAGIWSKLDNTIGDLESKSEKWLDEKEKKASEKVQKMMQSKRRKNIWDYIQIVWFAAAAEEGTPVMQDWLTNVLKQRPEGFIQTIIRHMKKSDKQSNIMQSLTLAAGHLDEQRKSTIDKLTQMVSTVFDKPLKKDQKKALYYSMEVVDGYTVINEFGKEAEMLYRDENILNEEISKLEAVIEDKVTSQEDRYSLMSQTKGLATWMTTGVGSIVQRRNALEIVKYSTRTSNDEVANTVDTLASLYAIQQLDNSTKETTAAVIGRDFVAVENMAKLSKGFMDYKKIRMTEMELSNFPKNYHREEYDSQVAMKIGKVSSKKDLADQGFELAKEIPNNGLGLNTEPLALYRSTTNVREAFDRSSIKYVGDGAQGRLLKEDLITAGMLSTLGPLMNQQMKNASKIASNFEKEVRRGENPAITTTVVPELDGNDRVVDYRAVVSVADKVEYLGLEANPMGVIGRNWAHEADVEETDQHNEVVWDEIMRDMVDHAPMHGTRGVKNHLEYVEISKDSGVFEVKDAARILPKALQEKLVVIEAAKKALRIARRMHKDGSSHKAIREAIKRLPGKSDVEFNEEKGFYQVSDSAVISVVGKNNWERMTRARKAAIRRRLGRGHIMVRRDMVLDTFGIRDLTAAEWVSDKVLGKKVAKALRASIRLIESAWKEVVKIFKVDMIIRMLPVIMGNIVSNLMYSIQYGLNPLDVAKRQLEGVGALKDYLESKKKLTQLIAELSKDPENLELQAEQARIISDMKLNPAMPLLDAHLYQHIVEDVGLEDFKSSSKIARLIDDSTEGVPQFVKTGVHWMFVSEKTSLFQMVTKATAYSDFVARYAQYTLSKEKALAKFERTHGRRMTEDEVQVISDELVIQVRDAYVNYAKPDSRLLQYFNDMGFVAFTKYAVRIQQAIGDLLRGRPLRFALAMIGQELFEGVTSANPDDIAEKSVFTRGPSSWFYSPGVSTILGNIIEPQMYTNIKSALS